MVYLLDIIIFKLIDYLFEGIFLYVQSEVYLNEDIDRFMVFVIQRYDLYVGVYEGMKELKFVLIDNGCVRVFDFFDLRSDLFWVIFVGEDVFFVGDQYNDFLFFVVLEKFGMKSDDKIIV